MKRSEFIRYVDKLSDNGLYELAKKFIISEGRGNKHNYWKLDIINDTAVKRNPGIIKDAQNDACIIISSLEADMQELKVIDIKRIDYLSKEELVIFIRQTIGAAKGNPPLDMDSEKAVDILKRFGLNKNTILCKVTGQSMENARIFDGDTIIVDTKAEPKNGCIVVASVNSELFVKRMKKHDGILWLLSENEDFQDLKITDDIDFRIIGVVKKAVSNIS